jgi:hypothetical protein
VDFVDLTACDHHDSIQERLIAREILRSVDHNSTKHHAQVTRDASSDDDDDNNDHDSETSELLSLQEIFANPDEEFGGRDSFKASILEAPVYNTRREYCREGDSEARDNPAATTAASVAPGANQGE